jgi:curved DNA-binding protein CbpA
LISVKFAYAYFSLLRDLMKKTAVTYYDILNLSPRATDDDVRRAYRTLALRWHPDRNPQGREAATRYTALLNEAYTHLRTAPQRRAYDRTLCALIEKRRIEKEERNDALTMLKEIFWPLAPRPQEMSSHG